MKCVNAINMPFNIMTAKNIYESMLSGAIPRDFINYGCHDL